MLHITQKLSELYSFYAKSENPYVQKAIDWAPAVIVAIGTKVTPAATLGLGVLSFTGYVIHHTAPYYQSLAKFEENFKALEMNSNKGSFRDELDSLKMKIEDRVQDYHKQHSSGLSLISARICGALYGNIDAISDGILDKINASLLRSHPVMVKPVDNPLERLLPINDDNLRQVMSYLPSRAHTNFSNSTKRQEAAVGETWIQRAKKFGYVGTNPKEAEKYINDLGNALSYFIEKDVIPSSGLSKKEDPDQILTKNLEFLVEFFKNIDSGPQIIKLLDYYFSNRNSLDQVHAKRLFSCYPNDRVQINYYYPDIPHQINRGLKSPTNQADLRKAEAFLVEAVKNNDQLMIDIIPKLSPYKLRFIYPVLEAETIPEDLKVSVISSILENFKAPDCRLLDLAIRKNLFMVAKMLIKNGFDVNAIYSLFGLSYEQLTFLLENGFNPNNACLKYGERIPSDTILGDKRIYRSALRFVMEEGYKKGFFGCNFDKKYLPKIKLLLKFGADIDFVVQNDSIGTYSSIEGSARHFLEEKGLTAMLGEWEPYANEYKQEVLNTLKRIILEKHSLDHLSQDEVVKLCNSIDVKPFLKDESRMAELPKALAIYVIQNHQKLGLQDDNPLVKASLDILAT